MYRDSSARYLKKKQKKSSLLKKRKNKKGEYGPKRYKNLPQDENQRLI